MRFAYADPPYLGWAEKFYGDPTYDSLEAHRLLVERLCSEFDGWAMSLYSNSLHQILPLCPTDTRIAAWVKPWAPFRPGVSPGYLWEPVLFRGARTARQRPKGVKTVRDWLSCNSATKKGLRGAKPDAFCSWLLDLLGVQDGDSVEDLFPGTGTMGRVAASRLAGATA